MIVSLVMKGIAANLLLWLLIASSSHILLVSGQFFLPNHPFMHPVLDDYEVSFQRGPCPGLNALANHGYINRNGSDIVIRDIAKAAELVFGIEQASTLIVAAESLSMGIPATTSKTTLGGMTLLTVNLYDLFIHNAAEHDASMVSDDHYFNKYTPFNESLFDQLEERSANGTLTFYDLVEHRSDRILDSRSRNPESSFDHHPLLPSTLGRELVLMLAFGDDPQLQTIRTDFLRVFLQENRIPDDFVPRSYRGLPLTGEGNPEFMAKITAATDRVITDITLPLTSQDEPATSTSSGIAIFIFSVVAVFVIVMLLTSCFAFRKQVKVAIQATAAHFKVSYNSFFGKDVNGMSRESTQESSDPEEASVSEGSLSSVDSYLWRPAMTLSWKYLSVSLRREKKKDKHQASEIVSNVSGEAPAGDLTCILGHSGAGKSTLLNVLSGRLHSFRGSSFKVKGQICVNGDPVKSKDLFVKKELAYVKQENYLVETMTAREAIRFSARLRLPQGVSEEDIESMTDEILGELGLTEVQNRDMGDGLSGGEKRRVNLGIALIFRPSIVLLDEVTSGLDSHNASVVVQICKQIARSRQAALLMSIHQPNSEIFSLMDNVILMASGNVVYNGSAREMESCFDVRGFSRPSEYSVTDWVLKVSTTNAVATLQEQGFLTNDEQHDQTSEIDKEESRCSDTFITLIEYRRVSILTELKEVLWRELVSTARDPRCLFMRFGSIALISALVAVCYWGVGSNSTTDPQRFSSHVGAVFLLSFGSAVVIILGVKEGQKERRMFCHEYPTGHYRLVSFAIAKVVLELLLTLVSALLSLFIEFWALDLQGHFGYWLLVVYLYALVSSALGYLLTAIPDDDSMANEQIPLVITPQLLLSGFLVTYETLPVWIRWCTWIQPLTYAFRLSLNNEFSSCLDLTDEEKHVTNCAKALEAAKVAHKRDGLGGIYNEESVVTLMQGGQYIGTDAILEYFQGFSPGQNPGALLWDFCELDSNQILSVNEVGEGYCDVTIGNVARASLNPFFERKDIDTPSLFHLVFGHRVRFGYSSAISSMSVLGEDLFLPPRFFESFYLRDMNSAAMASAICRIHESECPNEYAANNYVDSLNCMEKMDALPLVTQSSVGLTTVDSNSTGCRHLHASMALVNPTQHCAHLSFTPMEDPSGKVKCSESSNYDMEDFFSEKDYRLFQRVALAADIDTETYYEEYMKEDQQDPGTCRPGIVDPAAVQQSSALPENYVCNAYLDTQKASGELNTEYWIALVCFFVGIRLVSLALLRRKALKGLG